MLPSTLTEQLVTGTTDFLRASFTPRGTTFQHLIDDFVGLDGPLWAGPFISLALPFQTGNAGEHIFPSVPTEFPPYAHQEKAFRRLRDKHHTIVATGTGSGKTECFLIPILAECAKRAGERGVKAILIYPMNALATDQSERLASLIWNNENLRGKVTAGIYVGSKERSPHTTMGERNVITDRDVIRQNPPDILLTNYKMLDYLLIRPEDQPLWAHNGPDTLSYLVVDELHTFDGAQGTDLACLLRRLESRLDVPDKHLCYVGTSATLGGGGGAYELVEYATAVFGANFDEDAVVTEQRVSVPRFLAGASAAHTELPDPEDRDDLDPANFADEREFLDQQMDLWFGRRLEAAELGRELKQHYFLRYVLDELDGTVRTVDELVARFERLPGFVDRRYAQLIIGSLLALISAARTPIANTDKLAPLMSVRLQLWQREMRRMVASVGPHPKLRFFDDLTAEQRHKHLPVVHCRECGAMGWATLIYKDRPHHLNVDLRTFYKSYFDKDPRIAFVYPAADDVPGPRYWLDTRNLRKQSATPEEDIESFIEVVMPATTYSAGGTPKLTQDCVVCGANQSTALIGFQASTLTSTFINQLFASRYNDDKKLLTFSDSVQDAAHRAGFFEGRTWRFNLRIAIQRALLAGHAGGPPADQLPLSELPAVVADFWSSQLGEAEFVAAFIAPNMTWLHDYEALCADGELPEGSNLPQLIRQRLSWEVHAEYGLDARIGRSLPRTGASVTYVDPKRLDAAVEAGTETLRNEIGPLRELQPQAVRRILLGMLTHLRVRGAVWQPESMADYLASGGKSVYSLCRTPGKIHMPDYGPRSRLPSFLTTTRGTRRLHTLDAGSKDGRTWYQTWFERNVADVAPLLGDLTIDALHRLVEVLTEAKLLEVRRPGGTPVWGVCDDALFVTPEVVPMTCEATGEHLFVAAAEVEAWNGMLSLLSGEATYRREERDAGYYQRLYSQGEMRRIHAREHTGLLERDDRQLVETRFKADDQMPWDPNLLSCTPTLEMGIDIGALSSAILCSVPPTQANFLQRVGRAGRRDGNSLLLTVANARPHDLYFFADPKRMIAGDVSTPGVYLNAGAVLQRQLTGFCFDEWVKHDVEAAVIPRKLGAVFGQLDHPDRRDRFPHNLLTFVEEHQTLLLRKFVAMFDDPHALQENTVATLEAFMRGDTGSEGSLAYKIMDGLLGQRKDRDARKKALTAVQKKLRQLDDKPALSEVEQEEQRNLKREYAALNALVRNLNDRPTLSFFTDEGLLPNYAFPEAGVSLKSIIWRRRHDAEDDDGNRYESWDYAYERPARSAIVEFAPNAEFFAGGRKVQVNQVDVKQSEIEPWRFCDRCSFSDMVAGKDVLKSCPQCGSAHWADVGQRMNMLKLRQVFANTRDRDSRITDDREDRQPRFFNRQTLVTFGESGDGDAWYLGEDNVPFGFEFHKTATFREINFGEFDDIGGKVAIAGRDSVRRGFMLCTECGMVQGREAQHMPSCKFAGSEDRSAFEECLYLYREFSSEAVRLLLPFIDELGYEQKLHSFVAALELGLRDYFGGRIDHLESTVHSEPVENRNGRKQFLVLYDTVPGGTGYLAELVRDPQTLFGVLETALSRMVSCSCRLEADKDGCYNCLFAYRHSYDMAETSRTVAEDVLSQILAHRDDLQEVETLGAVDVSVLVESVLERRFLEALRRMGSSDDHEMSFSKQLVRGRPGFRFEIDGQAWAIEPQVDLGPTDGVIVETRPDFVFWPATQEGNRLPVAVYTDGYEYHRDRIGKDFFQRMAVGATGRYRTWSLSWDDVEAVFDDGRSDWFDLLGGRDEEVPAQFLSGQPWQHDWQKRAAELDSMALFIEYLATPPDAMAGWSDYALLNALLPLTAADRPDVGTWVTAVTEQTVPNLADEMTRDVGTTSQVGWGKRAPDGFVSHVFTAMPADVLQARDGSRARVLVELDDLEEQRGRLEFRSLWNGTLRAHNILQFLGTCLFVTSTTQGDFAYGDLLQRMIAPTPLTAEDIDWQLIADELLEESHVAVLEALRAQGAPLPMWGPEPQNDRGHPTGPAAELGWPARRVGLFLPEVIGEVPSDWTAFDIDDAMSHLDEILRLLGDRDE